MDYSVASVGLIDEELGGVPRTKIETGALLDGVTAYVGEVVRRKHGGKWLTMSTVDGDTVSPVVVCGPRTFQPAEVTYDELIERGKHGSQRGAIEGWLQA